MWDWLRQTFIEPAARTETRPSSQRGGAGPLGATKPASGSSAVTKRDAAMASAGGGPEPAEARGELPPRLRQAALPAAPDVATCDTVALDFETANSSRASPCAIGLVWLRDGAVAHRAYRLVRPPGNRFDFGNIRVHGIHPGDVEREPEFPALWRELAPLLSGRIVLAHNAAFDTGVLVGTLQAYGLRVPDLRTVCTLAVARRAWPELPRHGLREVASFLGIAFRHHHALEVAEASAAIARHAASALGLSNVVELQDVLRSPGQRPVAGAHPSAPPPRARRPRPAPLQQADPSHPLHGRTVVVTGVLRAMTRDEAMAAVAAVGGRTVAAVSSEVDYVVTGLQPGWSKLGRARELQAAGSDLTVIDEDRFLDLLRQVPG